MLWWVIPWIGLSLVAGAIAGKKGRSAVGFFFLSLAFSPLIGILAAAVAKQNAEFIEQDAIRSNEARKCPFCAELVKLEAVICKHCLSELTPVEIPQPVIERPAPEVIQKDIEKGKKFVLVAIVVTVAALVCIIALKVVT